MAKKVSKKDFDLSDFDLSDLGGDSGGDDQYLGDPGAYGGNSLPDPSPIDESNIPIPYDPNTTFGTLAPGIDPISFGDPNGASGMTPAQFVQLLGGGASALKPGSSGKSPLSFTNPDGSMNWMSLLPLLASVYGGVQSHNATGQATSQILDHLNQTGDQVANTLKGNGAGFQPYMQAGQGALTSLQNMPPSNIASQFKPIGSGKGLSLASIARGR